MKHRILTRILAAALAFTLLGTTASAAVAPEENIVQPRFLTVASIVAEREMTFPGLIDCYSDVTLNNLSYTATLKMELQRSSNGTTWTTLKSWNTSGTSFVALDKSWYVLPGYQYQVKATVEVRNSAGTHLETVTKYSAILHY